MVALRLPYFRYQLFAFRLFFTEMANRDWHTSYATGIAYLNRELRSFYAAHPGLTQIHLTVNMVRGKDGSFPTLKSKAAECRHLSGFAVVLARVQCHGTDTRGPFRFRDPRLQDYFGEYRTLILAMTEGLNRFHEACQAEPFVVHACRESMHAFIQAQTSLRALNRRHLAPERHESQPFAWRPKGHMLEHLVNEQIPRRGSPKTFWCYADEDFVGIMKRIAMQTKHPKTMGRVILQTYRLYAGLHVQALVDP